MTGPKKILLQAFFIILGPFWPIVLLCLVVILKLKPPTDEAVLSARAKSINKFTSRAQQIAIGTLAILPCFLQLHLMVPSLNNTDWLNITWAMDQVWFFKAELLSIGISTCLMAFYFISSIFDLPMIPKVSYALQLVLGFSSRLLFINLFAMVMGGFSYTYIIIVGHVLIMYLMHMALDLKNVGQCWKNLLDIDLFLRILTSMFMYHPGSQEANMTLKLIMTELIILIENLAIWVFLFLSMNSDLTVILISMWTFYLASVLFKIIYYIVLTSNLIEKSSQGLVIPTTFFREK